MRVSKSAIAVGSVHQTSDGKWAAKLTMREIEVGHWLSCGKTNREIAVLVNASPRTVDKHVEHILAKLHVENRTTAAIVLRQGA
jgi:DNA-binding NarL/FixJ family response regulator